MKNQTNNKYSYVRTDSRQRGVLLENDSVKGEPHRTPQAAKRFIANLVENGTLNDPTQTTHILEEVNQVFVAIANDRTTFFLPCACGLHGGAFVAANKNWQPATCPNDKLLLMSREDANETVTNCLRADEIDDSEAGWLWDEINEVMVHTSQKRATL